MVRLKRHHTHQRVPKEGGRIHRGVLCQGAGVGVVVQRDGGWSGVVGGMKVARGGFRRDVGGEKTKEIQ